MSSIFIISIVGVSMLKSQDPFWKFSHSMTGTVSFTALSPNKVIACADNVVYLSTDDGVSWKQTAKSPGFIPTEKITSDTMGCIYVPSNGAVAMSRDDGNSWSVKSVNGYPYGGFAVLPNGYMFYGTNFGVYRSIDSGSSWQQWSFGDVPAPRSVITQPNGNVYAMFGYKMYERIGGFYTVGSWRVSSDKGATWNTGETGSMYYSAQADGNRSVFAYRESGGTGGSIQLSIVRIMVNGSTIDWNSILTVGGYNSLLSDVFGSIYIANDNGVFKWPYAGGAWYPINAGLTNVKASSLFISPHGHLLVSTPDGVFRSTVSTLGIDADRETGIPRTTQLYQNFPNPFNPATKIRFDVSKKQFITVKIFNSIGQEVSVLVARVLEPGSYSETWNGFGNSSGVYFCRLQSAGESEVKKILLQK